MSDNASVCPVARLALEEAKAIVVLADAEGRGGAKQSASAADEKFRSESHDT